DSRTRGARMGFPWRGVRPGQGRRAARDRSTRSPPAGDRRVPKRRNSRLISFRPLCVLLCQSFNRSIIRCLIRFMVLGGFGIVGGWECYLFIKVTAGTIGVAQRAIPVRLAVLNLVVN